MYRAGTSKMGDYYAAGQKMNNTIVEYINGMEVVKVFNRDGESYHRFEADVKNYRDFTLDWFRACWLWMALYTSILPCVALVLLPVGGISGAHRRLNPAGLRAGIVHVLFCGTASDSSHELYVGAAPAELQDRSDGSAVQHSAPERRKNGFQRK